MTREQLDGILEAAIHAPSACNLQSWHFYALLGKDQITRLVPDVYKNDWILSAACAIVVCTDNGILAERFGEKGKMFALQDTAAAMQMMLLQSAEMGFGSCWIGAFDSEKCRDVLNIPEAHEPVAMAVIGTVESLPPMRERKDLADVATVFS